MRILLVEDDVVIASQIAAALEREKYVVEVARDGEAGLDCALGGNHALIVLDVMLPLRDGWSVCEELRKDRVTTPILMLTARDSVDDRVRGLQGGADDYLPKPFDIRELLARMSALLRRDKIHRTGIIKIGDLEIDSNAHKVSRRGQSIDLTPREFSLLEALARNEGRTLTRQTILDSVWNNEESLENTVNFHITSLRKKLDAAFDHKLVHTVHGIGYVLRAPDGMA
jgi:DNA-binding response OmpR family regulator